ncbi:metal-dependent hydrolase [Pseudomonas fluorescens ABAC62]|nr:metal-dependent hydrolase [Pseudomonas fluorescens ABAC62]
MLPIRRDVRFTLPAERITNWHEQGPFITHFFNALSLLFPQGELFFMDSVRHYRQRVEDPALKKEIQGFIGQEAMHSREHLQKKHFPPAFNLAITIALEHYTAMLAEVLLSDPSRFGDSLEGYQQMWYWHALEETEHKAVAYDVWNTVIKPGPGRYLLRTGAMLTTTVFFWLVVLDFHLRLLIADRESGGHLRGFWRMLKFLYGRKGIFPRMLRPWLHYFKPGFHPWDHDNRERLAGIDRLIEDIEHTQRGY